MGRFHCLKAGFIEARFQRRPVVMRVRDQVHEPPKRFDSLRDAANQEKGRGSRIKAMDAVKKLIPVLDNINIEVTSTKS
jgi:hypothetical protein